MDCFKVISYFFKLFLFVIFYIYIFFIEVQLYVLQIAMLLTIYNILENKIEVILNKTDVIYSILEEWEDPWVI